MSFLTNLKNKFRHLFGSKKKEETEIISVDEDFDISTLTDDNRFQVIGMIGTGKSAVVLHVRDKKRNEDVALKVLKSQDAFDALTTDRFQQEAEITNILTHENIIKSYELVNFHEKLAFTMELVKGHDLSNYVSQSGQACFNSEQIDTIICQLLDALSEIHKLNLMHRDIKLENIILGQNRKVKLSDFGLTKVLDRVGYTSQHILLGTPHYMAPEYILGKKVDRRADLYAVGIVLYELLAGHRRRLKEEVGNAALIHLRQTNFSVPKLKLSGKYSKYLPVLEKALAVNPEDRYNTAEEMKQAIIGIEPQKSSPEKAGSLHEQQ